jgi:hypothetical protein
LLIVAFAVGVTTLAYRGYGQTPSRPHVYVTHLEPWSASGGFDRKPDSRPEQNAGQPSYTKQFERECTSVVVTDLAHADYAVAIDDKRFLLGRTNAKAARFQYELYNRDRLIFAGGEDLLGNAIKKTCNAIAAPNTWIREE